MLKIVYAINSMGRTWDYRIKIMVLFWMSLVGGKLCFMTLIPGHCSRCSGWRIGRRTNRSKAAAETNSKWEISAFNSSQTATYGTAVVVAQLVEWSLSTPEVRLPIDTDKRWTKNGKVGLLKCCILFAAIAKQSRLFLLNGQQTACA